MTDQMQFPENDGRHHTAKLKQMLIEVSKRHVFFCVPSEA
jgi:hypothetical protein